MSFCKLLQCLVWNLFFKGNYYFLLYDTFTLLKLCKKARKKLIDRPFKILIHSQVKAKFDCQHLGIIFFSIFLGGKSVCMTNWYQSFRFFSSCEKRKIFKRETEMTQEIQYYSWCDALILRRGILEFLFWMKVRFFIDEFLFLGTK